MDNPPEPKPTPTPEPSKHPQDEHGHFIRKDPQVSGLLRASATDDDETLINVKVNNPLHKIMELLQSIKNHQSTTVSLRFTIPLIALPIVLLAAFQLGRVQTTCSPVFTSQVGTLQIISLQVPRTDSAWYTPFTNLLPGNFAPQKTKGFTGEDRAILLSREGTTLSLLPAVGVSLTAFNHQSVIVSGEYSACNKALTIDNPANIQLLQ